MSKYIKVTRTVTGSSKMPFNDDFYPDMTLDQAIEFERNLEPSECVENFFDVSDFTNIKTLVEVVEEDD